MNTDDIVSEQEAAEINKHLSEVAKDIFGITTPIPYVPTPPRGVPLLMYPVADEAEAAERAAEWVQAPACLYRSTIIDQLYLFVTVTPVVWRGLVASIPVIQKVSMT